MPQQEPHIELVFSYLDEFNRDLPAGKKLKKELGTILIGSGGVLDSFELIAFLTGLETKIVENFGGPIQLLDHAIVFSESNPLETIGSLIVFLAGELRENYIT